MELHGLFTLFLPTGTTTAAGAIQGRPDHAVVAIQTGAIDVNLHVRPSDVAIAERLVESLQAAIAIARATGEGVSYAELKGR